MPKTKIQKKGGKITRKQKIINFKKEVKRCLLLSKEDREFWMNNADNLPQPLVEEFYETLKTINSLMEKYLKKALDEDPALLDQLKQKVKKIKRTVLRLEESDSIKKENLDQFLEEEIKNI